LNFNVLTKLSIKRPPPTLRAETFACQKKKTRNSWQKLSRLAIFGTCYCHIAVLF